MKIEIHLIFEVSVLDDDEDEVIFIELNVADMIDAIENEDDDDEVAIVMVDVDDVQQRERENEAAHIILHLDDDEVERLEIDEIDMNRHQSMVVCENIEGIDENDFARLLVEFQGLMLDDDEVLDVIIMHIINDDEGVDVTDDEIEHLVERAIEVMLVIMVDEVDEQIDEVDGDIVLVVDELDVNEYLLPDTQQLVDII